MGIQENLVRAARLKSGSCLLRSKDVVLVGPADSGSSYCSGEPWNLTRLHESRHRYSEYHPFLADCIDPRHLRCNVPPRNEGYGMLTMRRLLCVLPA